jgi:small subunit ribosomal protein S4
LAVLTEAMENSKRQPSLSWLAVDAESFSGRMLERPQRASIPLAAQEQLVVELYSK